MGQGRCGKKTVVMVETMGAGRLTRSTARMMCDPHIQLLAPLVIYSGVSLGFLLNDFTVVSQSLSLVISRHPLNDDKIVVRLTFRE